jgi:type IV secretion system protein VirB10
MANDSKKPKNDALEEALKEFEGSGGFDGSSRSSSSKTSNEHENAFEEDFEELPTSGNHQNEQEDDDYIEYDEHSDADGIDQDFDVMDDNDLENDEFEEHTEVDDKKHHKKQKSSKNFNDADGTGGVPVISKLKEPKNIVMLIIAICFILFLVLGGDNKAKKKKSNNIEDEIASEVSDFSNMQNDQPAIDESSTPKPIKQKKQVTPEVALQDIELPSLDIKMPEIKEEDADLIPKIPEPKMLDEEKSDKKTKDKITDINIQEVNIRDKNEKSKKSEIIDVPLDVDLKKKKREPIAKKDGEMQKSLITDFTGGAAFPLKQKNKKNAHDFIFMDTDLDIEKEDEKSVISATRIQNPENVISQGRIIDAVLETAVNSSISGQVRAIVTRDVYAEVGRNILVPKGTRLYGEYGAASASSGGTAGSGANAGGRIVIKWSRIMRPDNVSATIDSYASDQFGRSGISGQVDSNYIGGITSSVLLSTIPLVTTIIANAITNTNPQTVTVGGAAGATTVIQDPVNIATQAFTKSVGTVISDITKNAINTQPTITLDQGTRVKVLVNKDIKLPTYKPLTKASGSAFSE